MASFRKLKPCPSEENKKGGQVCTKAMQVGNGVKGVLKEDREIAEKLTEFFAWCSLQKIQDRCLYLN